MDDADAVNFDKFLERVWGIKSENIDSEKIFEEFLIDVENPENIIEWESTKNLFCKTAKSLLEGN